MSKILNEHGVEEDAIAMLCRLVREAGLTMTLYGAPVTEDGLREKAEESVIERLTTIKNMSGYAGIKGKNI